MLWVTWRQHRAQALATAAFLVVLGAFLLVHGIGNRDAAAGLSGDALTRALSDRFGSVYQIISWLPIVPLLVGVFWGGPVLARELERGTHRLAWTQSVPRRRWLAVKLGVLGLTVTLAGLALGAVVSWWLSTFDGTRFTDRFGDTAMFGGTGVVAGAWWLSAFMLGVAAGGVCKRILPTMAVTIAVFVLAMFGLFQAREDYAAPVRRVDLAAPLAVGSYITDAAWLSPSGTELADEVPECVGEGRTTYLDCVADAGYQPVTYYQPADRYWRFQWTETGILLLATVLLAGPVAYRVARRPV